METCSSLAAYLAPLSAHPSDVFVEKIGASDGRVKWNLTYGGPYASPVQEFGSVFLGSDNNPILLGATVSDYGPGSYDAFIAKFKS